jgi:hypothetical protein
MFTGLWEKIPILNIALAQMTWLRHDADWSHCATSIPSSLSTVTGLLKARRFALRLWEWASILGRVAALKSARQELVQYIQGHGAKDYSTRDAFKEFDGITPRHSQHLPGREIPESSWVYWFLKKNVFFGMGAL